MQAKAGITDDIIEVLTNTSAELSKGRRKRPLPEGLVTPEAVGQFSLLSSHPLHKTSEVRCGVCCLVKQHVTAWKQHDMYRTCCVSCCLVKQQGNSMEQHVTT